MDNNNRSLGVSLLVFLFFLLLDCVVVIHSQNKRVLESKNIAMSLFGDSHHFTSGTTQPSHSKRINKNFSTYAMRVCGNKRMYVSTKWLKNCSKSNEREVGYIRPHSLMKLRNAKVHANALPTAKMIRNIFGR